MEYIFKELLFKKTLACSNNSSDSEEVEPSSSDTNTDLSDIEMRETRNRVVEFMTVISKYSEEEFRSHFRLNRQAMQVVENIITREVPASEQKGGRERVSVKKTVHFFVWYMANQETFREICDRFGICDTTGYNIVKSISKKLTDVSHEFINFPDVNSFESVSELFKHNGLIKIIGAIDGSHIPIRKPKRHQIDYVNRKGFHSILIQAVCDKNKKFIDVFVGEPGSIHDARLLKKSSLYTFLTENPDFMNGFCFLGDSAYPILNWLVPPFKDNGLLTREQGQFNKAHSSTRVVIENAFGLLKGRFRRLKHFENLKMDLIINCIIAACVLHNICLQQQDMGDDIEMPGEQHNEIPVVPANEDFPIPEINKQQELFQHFLRGLRR